MPRGKSFSYVATKKPFNSSRQAKAKLVSTLNFDSHEFVRIGQTLLRHIEYPTDSYLGKIYVNYIMSIETSLKAIIISLSKDDEKPDEVYLIVRRMGHDIKKLLAKTEERAFKNVKMLSKKDRKVIIAATNLGVSNRYGITSYLSMIQEKPENRYSQWNKTNSVLNMEFMKQLDEAAVNLRLISYRSESKYCDSMIYTLSNEWRIEDKLKKLY